MTLKKILSGGIKILITFGICYYLIEQGQLDLERISYLWQNPLVFFKILFILVLICLPLTALRWWVLLKGISVEITLLKTGLLTWMGNFFNSTLPGSVSGDIVKGYYIYGDNETLSKSTVLVSLLIDRITGLFGLIVISFFALLMNHEWILEHPQTHPLAWTTILLFLCTLLFYVLVFLPFEEGKDPIIRLLKKLPLSQQFLKIYTNFKAYQKKWKNLMISLLLAIISHSFFAYIFLIVSALLNTEQLDLMLQLFIMPIGLISTAIPISPGGIGVGHMAFESLYSIVGISGGANIFNLYIIIQLLVNLCGGFVYLGYKRK
ncbi:MAG: flippase-like domain-containing protein [Proteobacteria bacterium]|nr:flippase-like domain-containing protein [Pseudomonadota bacterium]